MGSGQMDTNLPGPYPTGQTSRLLSSMGMVKSFFRNSS